MAARRCVGNPALPMERRIQRQRPVSRCCRDGRQCPAQILPYHGPEATGRDSAGHATACSAAVLWAILSADQRSVPIRGRQHVPPDSLDTRRPVVHNPFPALADRVTDRRLDDAALDVLFREARTHSTWLADVIPRARLRDIYELKKWGPTSVNGVACSRSGHDVSQRCSGPRVEPRDRGRSGTGAGNRPGTVELSVIPGGAVWPI